jgi:hypothetical protein
LELSVAVVERLTGNACPEITREQETRLRAIAEANSGFVPLTEEEHDALCSGAGARVLTLAADEASNLHLLFCWDDDEAARLDRQRHLDGTGT